MVDEIIPNIYLVNAPAGSGKTTSIKDRILHYVNENARDNILCITYTNRAANELLKFLKLENVYISTIHSYIFSLIYPLCGLDEVIDLYFEIFNDKIYSRILNLKGDEHISKSNQEYTKKYGELSIDIIRKNFNKVSYAQSKFTSLYTGRLSHDDLLFFANKIIEKYPKLKYKINKKFQIVFIDEYQDTADDVLHLFYQAVAGTNTKLYLFGDKMQQIYHLYEGSFEDKFAKFTIEKLSTNYRSIKPIVNILNNLYNDEEYQQLILQENIDKVALFNPKIIISNNQDEQLKKQITDISNPLILHLFNRDMFKDIGAVNLYDSLNKMDRYAYATNISAKDILTDLTDENKDEVIKFLFLLCEFNQLWIEKKIGVLLQRIKKNKKIINFEKFCIDTHFDKNKLKILLTNLFEYMLLDNTTIIDIINKMYEFDILTTEYFIDNDVLYEYDVLYNVKISELIKLYNYLKNPIISTQHGVKGESHESVIFVAKDSMKNNPYVYMYKFFQLISKHDISLKELEILHYSYIKFIDGINNHLGYTISGINKDKNNENKSFFVDKCKEIIRIFEKSEIFTYLFKDKYIDYIEKPTVGNIKKCFKKNDIYGILSAYRLFYVGCSRARKNLVVIVDANEIQLYENEFIQKFKKIGFDIYKDDKQI